MFEEPSCGRSTCPSGYPYDCGDGTGSTEPSCGRNSCPVNFPNDCGNGHCCDSAHPYCCADGSCSADGTCGDGFNLDAEYSAWTAPNNATNPPATPATPATPASSSPSPNTPNPGTPGSGESYASGETYDAEEEESGLSCSVSPGVRTSFGLLPLLFAGLAAIARRRRAR